MPSDCDQTTGPSITHLQITLTTLQVIRTKMQTLQKSTAERES